MREKSSGVWGLLILSGVAGLLGVMVLAGIVVLQRSRAERLQQLDGERIRMAEEQALEAHGAAQAVVPPAGTKNEASAVDPILLDRLEAAESPAEREPQPAEDLQAELDKVKAELAAE